MSNEWDLKMDTFPAPWLDTKPRGMDESTDDWIQRLLAEARGSDGMIFQSGDFTLSSGAVSSFKIDCDAFNDADLKTLAALIAKLVGPFGYVRGVPTGGLRLADALKKHQIDDRPFLIVDDVLTTGVSMDKKRTELMTFWDEPESSFVGAVVFARGPCLSWIKAVFQMPKELW